MAWGDQGVSRLLRATNSGAIAWGSGGSPTSINIQQAGILRRLRMYHNSSTVTLGGGTLPTLDNLAPWNMYTLVSLAPNGLAPIIQTSGYGLYLVNVLKSAEKHSVTPDVTLGSVTNHETTTDIYSASNSTAQASRFTLDIPVAQRVRSLGGDVGMWPLQNASAQLQLGFTPNSATAASPYSIYNATAGAGVYTGGASTPTATITSPTVDLFREFYEVPTSAANLPVFNMVSTWIEEAPQGANVNSASSFTWTAKAMSGYIVRLGVFAYDGSTSTGIAATSLTAENALSITTDASTPKITESSYAALGRQREYYGFDLPQGFYAWDFLGMDLTMADILDTYTVGNIQFSANLSVALGSSNSSVKILRQTLAPLIIG